jgi:hypothetical protein
MNFPCDSCNIPLACSDADKSSKQFQICSKQCFIAAGGSDSCGSGDMIQCIYDEFLTSKQHTIPFNTRFGRQVSGYCELVWTPKNQRQSCAKIDNTNLFEYITG